MAEKKEWLVSCKISGDCTVTVYAESAAEAKKLANDGEWQNCDLGEWSVEDAERAELNE